MPSDEPPAKDVVVVDIDGTIADTRHRKHLVPSDVRWETATDEMWRAFNLASERDSPVRTTMAVVKGLVITRAVNVLFVTARPDWLREGTLRWLARHMEDEFSLYGHKFVNGQGYRLLMRPEGNLDDSATLKKMLLASHFGSLEKAIEHTLLVLEDCDESATALVDAGFDVMLVRGYGHHEP